MCHISIIHLQMVDNQAASTSWLLWVDKAVLNKAGQCVTGSFETMSRGCTVGSYGSFINVFLKQNNFQSVCARLYLHQQYLSVPFSPHPCQHLLALMFLVRDSCEIES